MRTQRQLLAFAVALVLPFAGMTAAYGEEKDKRNNDPHTASPIKHLIILLGENRTFDHVFGVYKPRQGETISNLLSKGIVKEDGTPGPNFSRARQFTTLIESSYLISARNKTPYDVLPPPQLLGTPNVASPIQPPLLQAVLDAIPNLEPNLAPADLHLLTTGASGLLTTQGVDTRVLNAISLPNGPFQLTGPNLPYDAYTGDPIHRFYQMWQQSDCSIKTATASNPSGCLSDLYPFVASSFSAVNEGGTSMAFLNMLRGDAPYLRQLADEYAMNDNYHQSQMGGTMVEHFYMAMADNLYFSDGRGNAIPAPAFAIANPNPLPDSNNAYTFDGFFSNCSDRLQPGVAPIVDYLASLPYKPDAKCEQGHFYVLNNVLPGFHPDGTLDQSGRAVPPSSVRSIGDALIEKGISFRYYGGGFNFAVSGGPLSVLYCPICNPFQFLSSIMTNPASRAEHLKDTQDLFADIEARRLPAVSYVKPDVLTDGHPQSSKLDLFEAFARNIIERVQSKPELFEHTAIFVTFDEGGGYYDSGFIQPLDFFGDGPRIPFIVVSPHAKGGHIVHAYADHASIVKFIEHNWDLKPLTARSRDNLPNPRTLKDDPYVPVNMPAIDDLFSMFKFGRN
jgi:phospholipase C